MKRTLGAIVVALAFGLAACGGDKKADDNKPADDKPAGDKPASDKPAGEKPAGEKPKEPDTEPDEGPDEPAAAAVMPDPGTVRLALIFDTELLRSEERAIKSAEKKLSKMKVDRSEATAEEKQAAEEAWSGELKALPAAWAKSETVIVLEVLEPEGKKPKRRSNGAGRILVLRPPATAPIYSEVVSGPAGWTLTGDSLGSWLKSAVALAGDSK